MVTGCHSPRQSDGEAFLHRFRTVRPAATMVPGENWLRTELYFGLSKTGGEVSDQEWQQFVADEITPRFPQGLTILGAYGQWQNASGVIQNEQSRVMVLLHSPDAHVNEKIEALRSVYCRKFDQEAVLRVTSPAVVSFWLGTNAVNSKALLLK